jgi:hypothetical protein
MAKQKDEGTTPKGKPLFEIADVAAIQALALGTAAPDQQKRALDWIINTAAKTYDPEYQTDSRDHAYCSGRRSVGLNIVVLTKIDLSKLSQALRG